MCLARKRLLDPEGPAWVHTRHLSGPALLSTLVGSIRRQLGTAQRIVVVVGLGVVVATLASYISSLGGFGAQFGWFGYALLSGNGVLGEQGTLSPAEQLLVWLGLVAAWAAVSIWLLQDDDRDYEPEYERTQDD